MPAIVCGTASPLLLGQSAELRSLRRSPWVETAAVIGQEEQPVCVQSARGGPVR